MENFWKKRASHEAQQSNNQNSDDSYIQDIESKDKKTIIIMDGNKTFIVVGDVFVL